MTSEDPFVEALQTGEAPGLAPEEQARLAELRQVLGSEIVWENPPDDLGDRIATEIGAEASRRPKLSWAMAAVAAAILVLGTLGVVDLLDRPPTVAAVVAMTGTEIAADVTGEAGLIPTPNGWAINLELTGLAPAPEGFFYQGWVNDGEDSVAVGTFHMRGDEPTPVALWSGVDLRDYRTLNISLQEVGRGPESSGVIVVTGTVGTFSDG